MGLMGEVQQRGEQRQLKFTTGKEKRLGKRNVREMKSVICRQRKEAAEKKSGRMA